MKKGKSKYLNYIGQTYSDLTILDLIYKETGTNRYYYKCRCVCGNITQARADFVLDKKIKSCGCYKKRLCNTEAWKERCRQMGLKTRIHEEKCDYCGANNHYAKGMCKNCYNRYLRNGDLEYHIKDRGNRKRNDRKSN